MIVSHDGMLRVVVTISIFFFFFFSSRRRHTRLQGDWSSDVCSSDLLPSFWPPPQRRPAWSRAIRRAQTFPRALDPVFRDRKSTRLNSSHLVISYAVFCLKKKKKKH